MSILTLRGFKHFYLADPVSSLAFRPRHRKSGKQEPISYHCGSVWFHRWSLRFLCNFPIFFQVLASSYPKCYNILYYFT